MKYLQRKKGYSLSDVPFQPGIGCILSALALGLVQFKAQQEDGRVYGEADSGHQVVPEDHCVLIMPFAGADIDDKTQAMLSGAIDVVGILTQWELPAYVEPTKTEEPVPEKVVKDMTATPEDQAMSVLRGFGLSTVQAQRCLEQLRPLMAPVKAPMPVPTAPAPMATPKKDVADKGRIQDIDLMLPNENQKSVIGYGGKPVTIYNVLLKLDVDGVGIVTRADIRFNWSKVPGCTYHLKVPAHQYPLSKGEYAYIEEFCTYAYEHRAG